MEHNGDAITFPAVARRAGVSVSLLYAEAALASRIATARDRQRQAGSERAWRLPARSLVTEHSLRAELANAQERSRRLGSQVSPDCLRGPALTQLAGDALHQIVVGHREPGPEPPATPLRYRSAVADR